MRCCPVTDRCSSHSRRATSRRARRRKTCSCLLRISSVRAPCSLSYPSLPNRNDPLTGTRLFPNRPRHRVALLHAPPPSDLLHSLQCLVFVGCVGRICRSVLQTIHHVWCCLGHGDGSLHDRVPPGFPEFRLAALGDRLPGSDLFGHGEPLHAHVCHPQHGGIQPEPQERRGHSQLGPVLVLP